MGKGGVVLGVNNFSDKIKNAVAHLVPTINLMAEIVPPKRIPAYEDIFPEELISRSCSFLSELDYMLVRNKDLLISLLSNGRQVQRLQSLMTERDAEIRKLTSEVQRLKKAKADTNALAESLRNASAVAKKNMDAAEEEAKLLRWDKASLRTKFNEMTMLHN